MVPITIFGVATPYAWEIVETCNRLGKPFIAIDNLGISDFRIPGTAIRISDFRIPGIVAPASSHGRAKAVEAAQAQGLNSYAALLDPTSSVASSAEIGCGTYLNTLVVVGTNSAIGCHANLNRSSSIAHDCRIGNYVSIGPGAILCGSSEVGPASMIGAGSVVLPRVKIGSNCLIGAGTIVTKNVPDNSVVVGNPGRILRQQDAMPILNECPSC